MTVASQSIPPMIKNDVGRQAVPCRTSCRSWRPRKARRYMKRNNIDLQMTEAALWLESPAPGVAVAGAAGAVPSTCQPKSPGRENTGQSPQRELGSEGIDPEAAVLQALFEEQASRHRFLEKMPDTEALWLRKAKNRSEALALSSVVHLPGLLAADLPDSSADLLCRRLVPPIPWPRGGSSCRDQVANPLCVL